MTLRIRDTGDMRKYLSFISDAPVCQTPGILDRMMPAEERHSP